MKRLIDLIIAAAGLVIAVPGMLVLGALIKLMSKGAIFHVHERVGQNGKLFKVHTLRSASADTEAGGWKGCDRSAHRVTPVGKFLRRAHLDALPQLVNVLRGEMSFIGPRPEHPHVVNRLKKTVPLYPARRA